jgi:hypothetical protein
VVLQLNKSQHKQTNLTDAADRGWSFSIRHFIFGFLVIQIGIGILDVLHVRRSIDIKGIIYGHRIGTWLARVCCTTTGL